MMENKIMVATFVQNSGKLMEKCMAHEKFCKCCSVPIAISKSGVKVQSMRFEVDEKHFFLIWVSLQTFF